MADDNTEPLAVHYYNDAEDAAQALLAASVLDLGVRLTNSQFDEQDSDGDTLLIEEWKLELFTTVPERAEED
ncbi:MAG: hypothetical protein ACRDRN_08710 [Sciscionella sp.]